MGLVLVECEVADMPAMPKAERNLAEGVAQLKALKGSFEIKRWCGIESCDKVW